MGITWDFATHLLMPLRSNQQQTHAMIFFFHMEYIPNFSFKTTPGGFPGGTVVKNPPANAGDTGSSPGPGRSHMLRSN